MNKIEINEEEFIKKTFQILDMINDSTSFFFYFSPDPDAIGVSIALALFLNSLEKKSVVYLPNGYDYNLNFLIKIAEYNKSSRTLGVLPNNFDYLAKTLVDFTQSHKEPIRSGKHLSKIMGGKAQRIRNNIREIFALPSCKNSELTNLYETMKRLLVQDLTPDSFADMYAQTLVYGLFVARFYDSSLSTFSRQEARDLIPASNPFLGHFFDHIAGINFEKRLSYIVDELCEVFTHANVAELMEQHFKVSSKKGTQRGQDQVIHFYEDFLKEYDDRMNQNYFPF